MTVRIRLLGPVELRVGPGVQAHPVDVGGPRSRALLARLALEPGRVVGLDSLVEAVWDGAPPAAPANAVQALVSRLRRAVPELAVRARPPGYVLDLPPDAVDAVQLEGLVAQARTETDPRQVADLLARAESLWSGEPLADLRDLVFTAAPAARWTELRLSATEQRLAAALSLGNAAAALPQLEALVAAHPLREDVCRLHVRALRLLGRPADALAAYERCRTRLAEELGLDPSPSLQAEQLAVLRGSSAGGTDPGREGGAAASRPRASGSDLRTPLTSFRGRDGELAAVDELLDAGRLVTLLGAGGAGKTRLALEAAHRRRAAVPDGVWWVELAPVADARGLPAAVLAAVGQRESTSLERVPTLVEAGDRLQEVFAGRRALLVLDNCEHLVGAVAQLADDLLAHCPGLQVLTTSREPLGVPGERQLPVGPLPVPDDDDLQATQAPVVRLFADRAAAVRPDFAVTPGVLPAVLEICRRLDGMPLALELAAVRLRTLSVRQIADRLDDRFQLLTGGSRVALPRHQTLRAVVEWSWDALEEREQAVGRRLSVFAGGATLDAVEQVCAGPGATPGYVLDAVTGLVEKSLLLAVEDADGSGGVRYRMLETVRAYGAEQLTAAGERERTEAAHTVWAVRLVDELDPQLRRHGQLAALRRLHAEHDGLLAVVQRAVAAGDGDTAVHLGGRLSWYWLLSGRQVAASHWLDEVLAVPAPPGPLRAVCQAFAAMGLAESGDWQAAWPGLQAVRDLPPDLTYGSAEPLAALSWALAEMFAGGLRETEGLARLAVHPDPWVVAAAQAVRTQVDENTGRYADLRDDLEDARAAFAALGDRWGRSLTAGALAQVYAVDGDVDAAVVATAEALRLSDELGTTEDSPLLRVRLALLHAAQGDRAGAEAEVAAVVAELEPDRSMGLAFAEAALGGLALEAGDRVAAERWHRSALARSGGGTAGPPQVHAMVCAGLGVVLADRAEHDPDRATELAEEAAGHLAVALTTAVGSADMPVTAYVLQGMAALALSTGDPARAARLLGLAASVRGRPDRSDPVVARVTGRLHDVLGPAETDRLVADGAAVPRTAALAEVGAPPPPEWPGPVRSGHGAAPGDQTRRR